MDDDDNCPLQANPAQADGDRDGVGDLCDNCAGTANREQDDRDEDGRGDACDEDIDGDGVANDEDDCPRHYDPAQIDINGDGIGTACDPIEAEELTMGPFRLVEGALRVRESGKAFRIPIRPCYADGCPDWHDWIDDSFEVRLQILFDVTATIRVVDRDGFVIGRPEGAPPGEGGSVEEIRFYPRADTFFRAPGTESPVSFQEYFLEIVPALGVDTEVDYPFSLLIEASE